MNDVVAASPTAPTDIRSPHVMAISSSGGHWAELLRLAPAWKGCTVSYVTTSKMLGDDIPAQVAQDGDPAPRFFAVPDANRWNKVQLLRLAMRVGWLVIRLRPDVIISTGAAPGFFACRVGKAVGARTIWLESIANADELSMSGRMVAPYADLWMTQWEHQLDEIEVGGKRMQYEGKVL